MLKKFMLACGTFALAVAGATTLHIYDPTWVNGTELKPGDYKLDVNGNEATIKHGKTVLNVPVRVEQTSEKYPETQLRLSTVTGHAVLKEIRLGGTDTKLVLQPAGSPATGQ
jgi:hypothetical protein